MNTVQESYELMVLESLNSSFDIDNKTKVDSLDGYDEKYGITNHFRYDLDEGDSGRLHVWERAGAHEIHHSKGESQDGTEDGINGEMSHTRDVNVKFVGTMVRVAKHLIDNGKRVRIVGKVSNGMFRHYNKFATLLAKREGYLVSDPKQYTLDSPKSSDFKEITISKNNSGIVGESILHYVNSRNETNNYGENFSRPSLAANPRDYTKCFV